MSEYEQTTVRLAVEFWKLLRVLDRALDAIPDSRRESSHLRVAMPPTG